MRDFESPQAIEFALQSSPFVCGVPGSLLSSSQAGPAVRAWGTKVPDDRIVPRDTRISLGCAPRTLCGKSEVVQGSGILSTPVRSAEDLRLGRQSPARPTITIASTWALQFQAEIEICSRLRSWMLSVILQGSPHRTGGRTTISILMRRPRRVVRLRSARLGICWLSSLHCSCAEEHLQPSTARACHPSCSPGLHAPSRPDHWIQALSSSAAAYPALIDVF
ncbi:uncharacterized protein BJX67DRAFT_39688 [Aspergillus lucknowensis]|uniref:Uncharacterized protein n=1 Tax=Aspergillus lucknowensis TaxID=176173 RepID=A0ABR4LWD4_9EURO